MTTADTTQSQLDTSAEQAETRDDEALDRAIAALRSARSETHKAVLGQEDVVTQMIIAMISGGHVLVEGPPGVGKTLLVRTLGTATGLSFARIQFTPDLMPADITGSMVLVPDETGRNVLKFQPGPIFTQLLLADEINRATPRTQSALLEAMQERTVSSAGGSLKLPAPFFVMATQNPIEMEGTYGLPEAQIDRFMFRIDMTYPSASVLSSILHSTTGNVEASVLQVITPEEIIQVQRYVRDVPIAQHVRDAVARFALRTQPQSPLASAEVKRLVRLGLSPRGAQSLVLAAKASALLDGRYNVGFEDIRAIMGPVTRHRVQLNFEGRAEKIDLDGMLVRMFEESLTK